MSRTIFHMQKKTTPSLCQFFVWVTILPWIVGLSPVVWSSETLEPEMVLIPAGSFIAGSSDLERSLYRVPRHEMTAHTVHLATFWIGRYEVTNDQYASFMNDGGYTTPSFWSDEGWNARTQYNWKEPRRWRDKDYHGRFPQILPVSAVSWYEAQAYCHWLSIRTEKSYRLPTELEWEKAARGEDGRIFPWGNEWNTNRCNWYGYLGEVTQNTKDTDSFAGLSPIGSFEDGKSPYGCYDMAGNVLEWCSDIWSQNEPYYRVYRGGCFFSNNPRLLRCAWRGGTYPDIGHVYWGKIGFRVARDATEKDVN